MEWGGFAIVLAVVIVAAEFVIGAMLPRRHVVARRTVLAQPVEAVWERISDRAAESRWRAHVAGVTREADRNGNAVWREFGGGGRLSEEVVVEAPRRLVRRLLETRAYSGEWEFVIEAAPGGSAVTVTERGEVGNPMLRFISRFFIGHTGTIDSYLRDLAKSFGQGAVIEAATPSAF